MRTRARRFVLATLLALSYLYAFPYFENMRHANELPRICLTMAMVDHQTFAIEECAKIYGETADMSPSKGRLYSNKAPGASMLAIPAYVLLKTSTKLFDRHPTLSEITWVFRVFAGVIPGLLFLWLLWHFLGRFAYAPKTRQMVIVAYGLGSMAFVYATQFMAHQLSAIAIGAAYVFTTRIIEEDWQRKWFVLVGVCAGAAPLIDYQAAFAGVPLAVYLIVSCVRLGWYRDIAVAALSSLPPVALLLFYHFKAFGHPLRTGYNASLTFAHYHQQGFLGMDKLRVEALMGSTLSSNNGLLVLCPLLILVVPGIWVLWKRRLFAHAAMTLSVCLIYFAFISSIVFWRGGWQVGPRYIAAMLPFTLPAIAACLSRVDDSKSWIIRGLCGGLIGIGVFVYAMANFFFPHFPEVFANPVFDLTWRLMIEGNAPWNLGWFLGLRGFWSFVPYAGLIVGLWGWSMLPSRRHWKSALAGIGVVALGLTALYQSAPANPKAEASYQRIVSWMPSHKEDAIKAP